MDQMQQAVTALKNAHAAGDTASATKIATAIKQMQSQPREASLGHKVGAAIDGAAQGLTFGFSDEIAAGLDSGFGYLGDYDKSLQEERARMAENKRLAGGYHLAGELPGMVASTLGTGGAGMARGALAAAKQGAKYGAVSGAGYSEADSLEGRAKDALVSAGVGGALGPVAQKVGNKVGKVAGRMVGRNTARPMPTVGGMKETAGNLFDDALDGVILSPQAMGRVHAKSAQKLANRGYHPGNQKGAKIALGELERLSNQNVTGRGVQTARELVSDGWRMGKNKNNASVSTMIKELDKAVAKPRPGDVIAGDAVKMARNAGKARGLWSKAKKLELLQESMKKANDNAISAGSGGNTQNTMLQAIKNIRNSKRLNRGFTQTELKAMDDFIQSHGTKRARSVRTVGKLAPSGNGLMLALGLGAASINPASLGVMGAAQGVRSMSEKATARGVEQLMRTIAGANRPLARTSSQRMLERAGSRALPSGLLASGLIAKN